LLRVDARIEVIVVDTVPRSHLRTNLAVSSEVALYGGDFREFGFWITNSGDARIR
jgi:hypothetical protein